MSYRLDLSGDLPAAVRVVAAEQLDDAVDQLRAKHAEDPVTAVHEARKDLKKVRSLLRLVRTGMPGKPRQTTNDSLREIAADLAGVRDADVMVETVDALRERYPDGLSGRAFSVVRRRFVTAAAKAREDDDATASDEVVAALDGQRVAVDGWRVGECERDDLAAGTAIAYERGQDLFAVARKRPAVHDLHEWRKRVKDLWYHARLLEEAWPATFEALAEEAHAVADLLGDDHDLGVLAARIEGQPWPPSVDSDVLLELCARRRAELEGQAFTLGRRLYAEKPKAFRRRIGAYLADE